jgi:hypothetical protein
MFIFDLLEVGKNTGAVAPFGLDNGLQHFRVNPVANLGGHPAVFLLTAKMGAGHVAKGVAITLYANSDNAPCIAHVNDDFVDNLLCVHFADLLLLMTLL